uniref:ABC-2 type transporter n=1 Tax=Neogoniolithon spectabile TaxID=231755 RepID=A0A3G3MGQ4_9FLOR|nr:ABC-2 type transporter [Neogoniolithon spectabile]AYR06007.1 ABC-2 type transporter [Neogoniolithon spectabile]
MNYSHLSKLKPSHKIHLHRKVYFPWNKEIKYLWFRLLIQNLRRPSSLITSLIQPLLWLILFGSLFKNMPIGLFYGNHRYEDFLSYGIIMFSSFTGSLNAGLTLIFDREFGFLNRLLTAPIYYKESILMSYTLFVICFTMIQTFTIMLFHTNIFCYSIKTIFTFLIIILVTILAMSNISVIIAFKLPGHIEFLAFSLIMNLPILFSSTTLAPLSFMPHWLQVLSSLNPLTYGIESIRFIFSKTNWNYTENIQNLWPCLSLLEIILAFLVISAISCISITQIITNHLD